MSDRFLDKDDRLQIDAPNFNRALNFKTQVRDLGLGFVFRTDNGKILLENSLIAPYFTVNGGWLQFKPKGDLLDTEGNQYDYSQNQLVTDGNFETDLRKLQASSNNGYDDNTFYLAAGIGLRVRLAKQIELKSANAATDSSKTIATSVMNKDNNGFDTEKEFTPKSKALLIKSNAREIPAKIEAKTNSDSTLTISALNSRNIEVAKREDSIIVWQYPFRRTQQEMILPQERETVYSRYNENTVVEDRLRNHFGVDEDKIERQPGALLIRGSKRNSRPEDRKVEVQVFY